LSESGENLRFIGIVDSEDEFNELVKPEELGGRGYKLVYNDDTGEWFLVKRYADGTVEYYKVHPALHKLAEQVYKYHVKKQSASLSKISSMSKYHELGLTYSSLATIHTAISILRRLLLEGIDESDLVEYAEKFSTREAYIDSIRRGLFRSYTLKPGVAEVARNILMTIIAYTSSLATPSSIQAMITAKLLLQMFEYDPAQTGIEYVMCVKRARRQGKDESICRQYLQKPGVWRIRSLSDSYVISEVNSLLNELEASLSACVGEASWSEDILQFHEVIIWIYRHTCSLCHEFMKTKEFEKLQRLAIRRLGIPFFMVDVDEPVSKSTVYQYLTIKTLLLDRSLTLPILIYYNFPERKVVIWSAGLNDHKYLPIDEHIDGLISVFFEVEYERDPSTGEVRIKGIKGEKQDASEEVLRTILHRTIIVEERGARRELVRQQVLLVLRQYGGKLPRKELIEKVAQRTRVSPQTVGKILNKMAGQDIIIDEKGVVRLVQVTRK